MTRMPQALECGCVAAALESASLVAKGKSRRSCAGAAARVEAESGSSRCRTPRRASPEIALLALGVALLAAVRPCAAQDSYIEGDSEIVSSPDGSQVYTWSETYLTPDLAFYYGAVVEGDLYQTVGSNPAVEIDWDYQDQWPYENDAIVELDDLISPGSLYTLISYHSVWAYWIDVMDGEDYYYNPDELSFESSDQSGSTDYLPYEAGPEWTDAYLIYLGSADAQLDAAQPAIQTLSPASAAVGTSGTINVTGSGLLDQCTGNTRVSFSGSGTTVTLEQNSVTDTQANVDYTIASNASTGQQTLTLSTCFGSGSANFEVGDPTPVIQQVNPNNWPAGQQTSFTITGSGFGTAPTVTVTGNGVTSSSASCAANCDTTINATVSVASNAPSGIATIKVTSTGYLGNGFISTGNGGTTNSATANATINATQGVAPTIIWGPDVGGNGSNCGGTNVAGQTENMVVGQQIAFTACLPQGVTNPQEWWSPSVPPGSAISGYSASTAGGCVVPFGQTLCEPSGLAATCGSLSYCDYPLFYWVDTGGSGTRFTFNYIYTQGGVTYTASAWVQVNVTAPSGISASAQTASVFIWAQTPPPPIMELGSTLLTPPGPGIQFTASPGTAPGNGQYWWTQLIGTEAFPIIFAGGRQLCLVASLAADPTPELDNTYPYGSPGNQASDSPLVYLSAEDGELSENFSAVMYLIWWPPADSRCPVGPGLPACAVPVPESYLGWSFCGDSINTLYLQPPPPNGNGTTWTLNGQSANPNGTAPFVPIMPSGSKTYGYPTWKNTIYKGSKTLTCTPYP